ncbi:MAG TPA: SCO2522 family protein [Amycolatopsis sp.]|nr:SCO2522 family protein [Amycolatopsis sp.]
MSTLDSGVYSETTERDKIKGVALSHLSIEVGHLYLDEFRRGEDRIRAQFEQVAPWVAAATAAVSAEVRAAGTENPRVSTCFLIDDYFRDDTDPGETIGKLTGIAKRCGITIDYLAREAACCVAGDIEVAELTAAMLLPEPPPGTDGRRPPPATSGWLCNGERSHPAESDQAMQLARWQPPEEFGKRNHSIFLDIELWRERQEVVDGELTSRRQWSCPFLAAVWQLLRLGMLRNYGEPVIQPQEWTPDAPWPQRWHELPPLIRLNQRAAPFAAFRSVSILPRTYLPVEHAVDVILRHLELDEAVVRQVTERGSEVGLSVPARVTDRLSHVFIDGER